MAQLAKADRKAQVGVNRMACLGTKEMLVLASLPFELAHEFHRVSRVQWGWMRGNSDLVYHVVAQAFTKSATVRKR